MPIAGPGAGGAAINSAEHIFQDAAQFNQNVSTRVRGWDIALIESSAALMPLTIPYGTRVRLEQRCYPVARHQQDPTCFSTTSVGSLRPALGTSRPLPPMMALEGADAT